MNQREPRFAVKRPRTPFWKTGLSRHTLYEWIEEGRIGDGWLVCEHGDTSTAVPLRRLEELHPGWEWDEVNAETADEEPKDRYIPSPRYSVKKPRSIFWKTGLTREDIVKLLEDQVIGNHWLICEHGVPESAVPLNKFDELHGKLMANWSASSGLVDWPEFQDANVWKTGLKVTGCLLCTPIYLTLLLYILFAIFH